MRIQLVSANLRNLFIKALSWCWEIEFFPYSLFHQAFQDPPNMVCRCRILHNWLPLNLQNIQIFKYSLGPLFHTQRRAYLLYIKGFLITTTLLSFYHQATLYQSSHDDMMPYIIFYVDGIRGATTKTCRLGYIHNWEYIVLTYGFSIASSSQSILVFSVLFSSLPVFSLI